MKTRYPKYVLMLLCSVGFAVTMPGAEKFYCKHCGICRSSVQSLTVNMCPRHPAGPNRGRHEVYEGSEKREYTCIFCGIRRGSIAALTVNMCPRHPAGPNKGRHFPAR